jgi:hypothetical protein
MARLHDLHQASATLATKLDTLASELVTKLPFNTLREWVTIVHLQQDNPDTWAEKLLSDYASTSSAPAEGGSCVLFALRSLSLCRGISQKLNARLVPVCKKGSDLPFHLAAAVPFRNPRFTNDSSIILIDAGLHIPKSIVVQKVTCNSLSCVVHPLHTLFFFFIKQQAGHGMMPNEKPPKTKTVHYGGDFESSFHFDWHNTYVRYKTAW